MAAEAWMDRRGGDRGGAGARRAAYVVVGGWFLAAAVAGAVGVFETRGPPLGIGAFALLPVLGFFAAYRASPALRRGLHQLPLWAIVLSHTWRFVGMGFVVASLVGALPVAFAWPAGLGDALAAAGAIPLAAALLAGRRGARLARAFTTWNAFGLADLAVAISLGILCSPGPAGLLHTAVTTQAMGRFPIHLVPTFFVPLFALLHLLALVRRAEVQREAGAPGDVRAPEVGAAAARG